MTVQITVRDVPVEIRNELASRAAVQGKSMQEFLLAELGRLAARPSMERLLAGIRERKEASEAEISASEILAHRDADRR